MELTEMKVLWDQMTEKMEQKELLNEELILEMTQHRYQKKFDRIFLWEGMGSAVCFAMALFILLRIGQLDTWYLLLCGIVATSILIALPVSTLYTLKRLRNVDVDTSSVTDTLLTYHQRRNSFLWMQRLGILLSFLLSLVILPVSAKLMSQKDLLLEPQIEIGFVIGAMIFLALFARWGYRCYVGITRSAGKVLEELEDYS